MNKAVSVPNQRLSNQQICPVSAKHPLDVVSAMGAIQAQDYIASLWAVGVRMEDATEAGIERALAEGSIVRSWLMRSTLQIVPAKDLRWMLALLTPRLVTGHAGRYAERGLDEETFAKSRKVVRQVLNGGNRLTRPDLIEQFESVHIASKGQRAYSILQRLAFEGLICYGPRQGKQPTFVLLDEWAPDGKPMEREQALAELTRRYFTSRGPATEADFAWWSGLNLTEARAGLDMAKTHFVQDVIDGQTYWRVDGIAAHQDKKQLVHLLPAFDEYLIAYRDRSTVVDQKYGKPTSSNNGIFFPIILSDGKVIGTWKRTLKKEAVVVTPQWFEGPSPAQQSGFLAAAERYAAFLGLSLVVE